MIRRHDVLIIGGGLVGASLAIALDGHGLDVGLVEATPEGAMPAVFDQRNLSFAAATVNALGALGVMDKLGSPTGPIRRIHVSRQGDFGRVLLEAADYGREYFGQVVVARDFGAALEARLAELGHLTRYRPARFLGLCEGSGSDVRVMRVSIPESGEQVIEARLLVGADGSHGAVRQALGIAVRAHDYAQTLFVARMRADKAPDGTAYERFTSDGPTALLPRGDRQYGVIHAVAAKEAQTVAGLGDEAWLARIQGVFGWRVGRFTATGERAAYPIMQLLAERTTDRRALLLGNAAQTIHPIGAQGFNLGLRDALTLSELLGGAADPGAPAVLDAYVERRSEDRRRTVEFSDGLARLTSNPLPLLRPLRSIGMLAAAASPSIQSMLVGGAMGFRGHVPALCREARA